MSSIPLLGHVETSTAYMTRNTLNSHPAFNLQVKREREETNEELCTLFIAVTEPEAIMQYKNLIETSHQHGSGGVVISQRNSQHGCTILELQGTSAGILGALLQVPQCLKVALKNEEKMVNFKILFDEKLRGKVIGRKGENISRVRAIPGFSVNVENDMVFDVDSVPLRFNALNVMGVDFQRGIPAALALTSPEEPKSSPKEEKQMTCNISRPAGMNIRKLLPTPDSSPAPAATELPPFNELPLFISPAIPSETNLGGGPKSNLEQDPFPQKKYSALSAQTIFSEFSLKPTSPSSEASSFP